MNDLAPGKARDTLASSWYGYTHDRNLRAILTDWQTSTAGDGTPMLSGRVAGKGATHALAQFIALGQIGLKTEGDTRPGLDFSTPGRVAYVWRYFGVWVELWHPDGADAAPKPVEPVQSAPVPPQAVQTDPVRDPIPTAARRAFLRGPGGRLLFTRKQRKETTTR